MIEKTYLKTKPECKVKFALPAEAIGDAKASLSLVTLIIGTAQPTQ